MRLLALHSKEGNTEKRFAYAYPLKHPEIGKNYTTKRKKKKEHLNAKTQLIESKFDVGEGNHRRTKANIVFLGLSGVSRL
jgi:hypothetical protein